MTTKAPSAQRSIFDAIAGSGGGGIEARFLAFHEANPWVYNELVKLARRAVRAGHKRVGIKMIWEVVRWNMFVRTTDPDTTSDFKLNNNYHSRYARLIAKREPDLATVFETRKLHDEE